MPEDPKQKQSSSSTNDGLEQAKKPGSDKTDSSPSEISLEIMASAFGSDWNPESKEVELDKTFNKTLRDLLEKPEIVDL
tara:strand:+ start:53 stop:289 length:237 start_codon:yes stop_codon:yes gene_type:complete